MPAAQEEIKAAEEEGIKIEYLVAPLKIEGAKGKVSSITCQRMVLGDFDSQRPKKSGASCRLRIHLKGRFRYRRYRPGSRYEFY